MGWMFVLYAGECQSCPEYERLPNDWPHNTDRTHGTRGEVHTKHTLSLCQTQCIVLLKHWNALSVRIPATSHTAGWSSIITKILIASLFLPVLTLFLLSLAMHFLLSHSCHPSTPCLFCPTSFKNNFSHWPKALIHLPLSYDVVLEWHSYYTPLPAPSPIPTVQREGVVLHPPCFTPSAHMASLASLGADSMGTQQT